jgi:hypothetical protein
VAGIAGNSPGRYPLIVGTVDPESFSPVGSTWAQNIGNGQRAWFEVTATSLDLVIANNQTFSGWSEQFGLSGAQASWMASPAGDGIPNLLKYAFNLDPLRHEGTGQYPGQDRGLPYLTPLTSEGLELIYYRDPAKTDLRLTPVWKTNLGATFPWAEVPDRELLDTQNGIERWRARIPLNTGRGFMQIQVEVE